MSVEEIQKEFSRLHPTEQRALSLWILKQPQVNLVKELLTNAVRREAEGEIRISQPTADNVPSGKTLERALQRVESLGLRP